MLLQRAGGEGGGGVAGGAEGGSGGDGGADGGLAVDMYVTRCAWDAWQNSRSGSVYCSRMRSKNIRGGGCGGGGVGGGADGGNAGGNGGWVIPYVRAGVSCGVPLTYGPYQSL